MTAKEGLIILQDNGLDSYAIACCKLGSSSGTIRYGKISQLIDYDDLDDYPSVIIIVGKMNFKEEEAMELWK